MVKKDKNLLLIVPKYFSYEDRIKNELIKMGFNVLMVYENVDEFSIKCKCVKMIKGDISNYTNKYYIARVENQRFDYVLAIRASTLTKYVIEYLKEKSPSAEFYMYQWDSVKNNPNALEIAPYFDKVSTFDMGDAKQYGWNYKPLFYTESSERNATRAIDIAYIGTLHSKRVRIYNKLKKQDCVKYLYLYAKFSHFLKEKYLKKSPEYLEILPKDVHYKSLSLSEVNDIMSKSNIIVDYTHPQQTGFTMRTCEAIGHRCKLVTNNKNILKADFYIKDDIYVYDEDEFDIPIEFIKKEYVPLEKTIYENYSITSWLKEFFKNM